MTNFFRMCTGFLILGIELPLCLGQTPAPITWIRVLEPEKTYWSPATNKTVMTWLGPTNALASYCRINSLWSNGEKEPRDFCLLFLPSTGQFYLDAVGESFFAFSDRLVCFWPSSFSWRVSTNRVSDTTAPTAFFANLKQELIHSYPRTPVLRRHYTIYAMQGISRFFGDGKITSDSESGELTIVEYVNAMGLTAPKIIAVGTDGTNAVVSYDCIKELGADRPVLTVDANFRVVQAELNGKPLILNRTNNIYVQREGSRKARLTKPQ
jgi:hypothetical protein